jgi:serine/threonine protein kinase
MPTSDERDLESLVKRVNSIIDYLPWKYMPKGTPFAYLFMNDGPWPNFDETNDNIYMDKRSTINSVDETALDLDRQKWSEASSGIARSGFEELLETHKAHPNYLQSILTLFVEGYERLQDLINSSAYNQKLDLIVNSVPGYVNKFLTASRNLVLFQSDYLIKESMRTLKSEAYASLSFWKHIDMLPKIPEDVLNLCLKNKNMHIALQDILEYELIHNTFSKFESETYKFDYRNLEETSKFLNTFIIMAKSGYPSEDMFRFFTLTARLKEDVDANYLRNPAVFNKHNPRMRDIIQSRYENGLDKLDIDTLRELCSFEIPNYTLIAKLGSGAMKTAYLGVNKHSGVQRAILVINPSAKGFQHYKTLTGIKDDKDLLNAIYEDEFSGTKLQELEDPKYIGLVNPPEEGLDSEGKKIFWMSSLKYDKTLADVVKEKGTLSEEEALTYFYQIAYALKNCHQAGIVHKDLKLENIGIRNGKALVGDFGCLSAFSEYANGQYQCPLHLVAPEMIETGTHTPASNVYALGGILHQMKTGKTHIPRPEIRAEIGSEEWMQQNEETYGKIKEFAQSPKFKLVDGFASLAVLKVCLYRDPGTRMKYFDELWYHLNKYMTSHNYEAQSYHEDVYAIRKIMDMNETIDNLDRKKR